MVIDGVYYLQKAKPGSQKPQKVEHTPVVSVFSGACTQGGRYAMCWNSGGECAVSSKHAVTESVVLSELGENESWAFNCTQVHTVSEF
jgi:hypothetical protein